MKPFPAIDHSGLHWSCAMRFDSKNDDLHDPSSYRDMIYFLRRLLFVFSTRSRTYNSPNAQVRKSRAHSPVRKHDVPASG